MFNIKDGYKTSEFWVTLATQIIGFATMLGYISPAHSTELLNAITTIIGGLVMIVPAVIYVVNRTWLKKETMTMNLAQQKNIIV